VSARPGLVVTAALVLAAGAAIAWVDTSPGWDDAGITAGAVLTVSAAGAAGGVAFWLSALLTVAPLLAAELPGGAGVLLCIPIALAGAAAGGVIRRTIRGA